MKIIVAMSGGVDSSVSAAILKNQGYDVIGVHMQNWDKTLNEGEEGCSANQDYLDVKKTCEILNIPLYVYNFVPEYWENVFLPYLENIKNDLNTNPDISCNVHIKFGVLLKKVAEDFGEDVKLATGHWAKITHHGNRYGLEVCKNKNKDQTYFLASLSENQLSRVIFPLSEISTKDKVRKMANEMNIPFWNKKDSVGICFIGKRNYRDFMGKYICEKPGKLVDVSTGKVLGEHKGSHLYVLHQRTGLFLKGYEEKYYVCGKNKEKNQVLLCKQSEVQKYLYRTSTRCEKLHWISDDIRLSKSEKIYIKVRHGPKFIEAKVIELNDDFCILEHEKMYVTTPGQAVVFYRNKVSCLGMGIYVLP